MTDILVTSTTLPDIQFSPSGTGVVYLRIFANQAFITSDSVLIQPGSPNGGNVYLQVICDVSAPDASGNRSLTIPSFTIDSTTDAVNNPLARYAAWFYSNKGRVLSAFAGFENFRVLPAYPNSPSTTASWTDIQLDNTYGAPQSIDLITYTKTQINYLIANALVTSSFMLNGLTASSQYFANDTNVTIVSAIDTHTITWAGQLAVARGGTGAANAAGARSNLSAAASGANSDITSLAGLTTALTSAQGGTGFGSSNNYTIGALLYAASTTLLSQITPGTSGFVLTSQGAGLAPVWAAAAGTISGGGSSGRATFWNGATSLSSSATFLFDSATNRLSIGTTDSTNAVNLANAGYLSGHGNLAAAQVKAIGVADATKYTGAVTTTQIDAVTLGAGTPVAWVLTDGGAVAINPLAPDYQVRTNGIRVGVGVAGAYNDSSSSNIFNFCSTVTNLGTAAVPAIFGQAIQLGANGTVWGINPVAYTDIGGASTASAIMMEGNFGALGASANQSAFGIVLAANAGGSTPASCVENFIQMQRTTGSPAAARAVDGIVFSTGTGQPVTNALLNFDLTQCSYIMTAAGGAYTYGLSFYGSTFGQGIISFPNSDMGLVGYDTGAVERSLLYLGSANYVTLGDVNATAGTRIYSGTSPATVTMPKGASGYAGDVGLNQTTTAAQLHITGVTRRALMGGNTFVLDTTTKTVTATGSAFTTELGPGSAIVFSSEPSTTYIVASIASDTSLDLTAFPAVNTGVATATADRPQLLIENGAGEDWITTDVTHSFTILGDSSYSDLVGMLQLRSRSTSAQRLLFGVNDASDYAYVSSLQQGVGWKPLILQGGASGTDVGGVVIGVPTPSSVGAMLKVEGAGAKTADNVASEFNNIATNASGTDHKKFGAQYLSQGSWQGGNTALYARSTGASSFSSGDLTNYPLQAIGGSVLFAPDSTQVATPTPPDAPEATLHIVGTPQTLVTIGADSATTGAGGDLTRVDGTGTTWNTVGAADRLMPGDAVRFGSDTEVYTIDHVASDTRFFLTANYNGTPASGVEVYADKKLLVVENAYGTERLSVESSGRVNLGGVTTQGVKSKALSEGVATSFVTINTANNTYIGGYVEYSIVADDATDYQCRTGVLPFSIVNKAGTVTAAVATVSTATETVAVSGGTLTNTFGTSASGNALSLQANATSSLTQTTLRIDYYVRITASGVINVQPL